MTLKITCFFFKVKSDPLCRREKILWKEKQVEKKVGQKQWEIIPSSNDKYRHVGCFISEERERERELLKKVFFSPKTVTSTLCQYFTYTTIATTTTRNFRFLLKKSFEFKNGKLLIYGESETKAFQMNMYGKI